MAGKRSKGPVFHGQGSYMWAVLRFWERTTGARVVRHFAKEAAGGSGGGGDAGGDEGGDGDDAAGGSGDDDDDPQGGAGGSQGGAGKEAYYRDELRKATKARASAVEETRRLKHRLDEFERKEREREEAERKAADEKAQKDLEDKRAYDEALKREKDRSAEEIGKRETRLKTLALRGARSEIAAAVAGIEGVVADAAPEIARLLEASIGIDDNDEPFVKDENGKPRRQPDDPSKPFTFRDLAVEFVRARPWYLKDKTPAGGGTKDGARGDGSQVWDIKRAIKDVKYSNEWKKADPDGHEKAWNAYIAEVAKAKV